MPQSVVFWVVGRHTGAYACPAMIVFLLIATSLPILDLAWWRWADLRLRRLSHARRWRLLLATFAGCNLVTYGWLFLSRMVGLPTAVPTAVLGACYIWHLAVLPATMLGLMGGGLIRQLSESVARLSRSLDTRRAPHSRPKATGNSSCPSRIVLAPTLTRRQALTATMVAMPPVATVLGQVRALSQLDSFRTRRLELELPTLPVALDGLAIAHVSDLHVGRFTNGRILDEVVTRTNALRPDLVLFTGDLIDHALADLPAGLDVLKRLMPRERLFMCEGNHDLFEGREEFEGRVREAGLPLLLNEAVVTEVRGHSIQILGLRWGQPGAGRSPSISDQMARLLLRRDRPAFTVLLAHHPHAFDQAAEAGIPLTLAGHTHGGQLMLSENVGAGSLLFKYWSGPYRKGASALVVSNGVGNWFPLRINAPAEILHLTLRAGTRQT